MSTLYHKTRKIAYQSLFIIAVLSLAGVSSLPYLFRAIFQGTQSVAVVNGLPITAQEFEHRIILEEQKRAAYRAQFGPQADEILAALGMGTNSQEQALEQLVNEKIILSAADALDIQLAPAYVASRLNDPQLIYMFFGESVPQYLLTAQGGIDLDRLKKMLQRQGMTMHYFEQTIENTLREHIVLSLVQQAYFLSPAAHQELIWQNFCPKTYLITQVSLASYFDQEMQKPVSEEALRSFFARQNGISKRYWMPERRSGVVWLFKQRAYDINASEGVGASDFERRFSKDVQSLLNTPGFSTFAEQKNATRKQLTGRSRDETEDPVVQQLFALTQSRRSTFFKDGVGYVVELTSVVPSAPRAFEEIQTTVRSDYAKEAARKRLEQELRSLSKGTKLGTQRTVTWTPGAENKNFEQLGKEGIPLERCRRMFSPGQALVLLGEAHGYRIELIARDSVCQSDTKEVARLEKKATQEGEQRLLYEFIASLRERATITMNTSSVKVR